VVSNAEVSGKFSATGVPAGKMLVPMSEGDENDLFTISTSGGTKVYEEYYLTINAPGNNGELYHNLRVTSMDSLEDNDKIKARCAINDGQTLLFANLFTQNTTIMTIADNATNDQLMGGTEGAGSIVVQAVNEIKFNTTGMGEQLPRVITQLNARNIPLYQSTQLSLKKTQSASTTTVAVDGVSFEMVNAEATSGFSDYYNYNSGVYVKVNADGTGVKYSYDNQGNVNGYYQQVIACNTDDITGERVTNFYEVQNTANGSLIDLRPYLTGAAFGSNSQYEVSVVSNVKMTYTAAGIEDQFPLRAAAGDVDGTIVYGRAALAYSAGGTTYSNNKSVLRMDTVGRKYYRLGSSRTSLTYNALAPDALSLANDSLGINPFDDGTNTRGSVKTRGEYNATQLNSAGTASEVRWTITVYRRQPVNGGSEYGTALDISKILDSIVVKDVNGDSVTMDSASTSASYVYQGSRSLFEDVSYRTNPNNTNELTNRFVVDVNFDVITGSDLESADAQQFYSNYKVVLKAELVGCNGSEATDWIIYTNAKIDPSFID
jgi:hypothetical protein